MATRAETSVVYAARVVQGGALVTFSAARTILTDPAEYDLSSTQYGTLFLPQVVTAIAAALLGAGLGGRFGIKRVYVAGLAGLLSMALLLLSQFFTDDQSAAFVLLLLATASLGAGFGLTVPALNTLTAALHPVLAALVAVAMGAWSFAVAMRRPSPPSLHPLPGHPAR
jgi:FHS family glucose/mannose:H+ symporter-like MFS transporter